MSLRDRGPGGGESNRSTRSLRPAPVLRCAPVCGRVTQIVNLSLIAEEFSCTGELPRLAARYNIAPMQWVAVVRQVGEERRLDALRWGLIPSWAKDPSIASRTINARSETVATKPAFRSAFRRSRCLIVVDGFYEWRREGKTKQPYYFRPSGGGLLALAGLWERWSPPEGPPLETFTIVTRAASSPVAEIHGRMPAGLRSEAAGAWLDPELRDPSALLALLAEPSPELSATAVSAYVNRATNEGPRCHEPVAEQALFRGA